MGGGVSKTTTFLYGLSSLSVDPGTPSPLLIVTGESIPLLCLEGVPGIPGAPQDEAGLTRKFALTYQGTKSGTCDSAPLSNGSGNEGDRA